MNRGEGSEKNFVKYSALGNDYIVIDPLKSTLGCDEEIVKYICDRNNGPGSDGVLYGPTSKECLTLRIFNPDGTECEKSGNGIRIFSNYLYDNGYIKDSSFNIDLNGESILVTPVIPSQGIFRVRLGKATPGLLNSSEYPFVGREMTFDGKSFIGSFIDIGNPHLVLETTNISADMAKHFGPIASNYDIFPNRTNVQFCRVVDYSNIEIQIYERGAGYTLASGSSSCAVVAALYMQKKVGSRVSVIMPGGELSVEIDENENIHLEGPSRYIYSGKL